MTQEHVTREKQEAEVVGTAAPDQRGPVDNAVPADDQREPTDSAVPADDLAQALDEARARVAELEDRWRRSVAELDNFRKRTAREAENLRTDERAGVLRRWLTVVDSLELALAHAGASPDPVVEGVRAVWEQALALMAEYGYRRYDDLGQPFDPALHEAVGTATDSSVRPGTVVHVVRARYGDAGRLLRPAGVIVATGES
ncbi:nucleotide exchange factor GrpE [Kribbella sp. NPDC006257]|uniref:nucleotide exchange factor GrpE n=1 Tax=Kribbella sp. NPDC006257 TaxID=3156738 RepID=UPI0033B9163E